MIDSRVPSRHRAGGGAARLPITRRAHAASLLLLGLAGMAVAAPAPARADDGSNGGGGGGGGEEEEGVLGAIKSIFDPNEKTKAGKVLPKAYLKAAREVVRTLRESLEEDDGGDMARFRRNADAAKESIREFLGGWRGQQAVAAEVRCTQCVTRSYAVFSSKNQNSKKKILAPAWRLKSRRNKKCIATAACKSRDESNEPN